MQQNRRYGGRGHRQQDSQGKPAYGGQRKQTHRAGAPGPSAALQEFYSRVAIAPSRKIPLTSSGAPLTLRVLDLLCPVGFGQRALILAPPRTGKTTFLKDLCQGVTAGAPQAILYCLLVDERPEEVTDFRRTVKAEVFASSNDRPLEEHLAVAATCLDRAVADTLTGRDVVIVLDSLTRLARAHNLNTQTGRTMSGGVDANALEMPKRLGLVISDSKGAVQAFRNEGNLRESDLMRYLRRYADPQRMVVATESNPSDEAPARSPRFVERSYPAPTYYSPPSSFRTGRSC